MKGVYAFLSTCCLISCGLAKPASVVLGYQDSLGQYSFGYSAPGSARSEIRTSNGATHGAYSYIDGTGVIQSAQYVADGENGFRVVASNLPQAPLPVQDTEEVMAARAAHLQAVEIAKNAENSLADADTKIGVKNVFLKNLKPDEQSSKSEEKSEIVKEEKAEVKAKSGEPEKIENHEESKTISEKETQEAAQEAVAVSVTKALLDRPYSRPLLIQTPSGEQFIILPSGIRVPYGSDNEKPNSMKEQLNITASSNTTAGTSLQSPEKSPEKIETKSSNVDTDELIAEEKKSPAEPSETILTPILTPESLNPYYGITRYAPGYVQHFITYSVW